MDSSLENQKQELRSRMREALNQLVPEQVEERGEKIQEKILASRLFQEASSLALYFPYQNEVRTQRLFEAARKNGKKVAFPRGGCEGEALSFYWVESLDQLKPTAWGPLGPEEGSNLSEADSTSIELMVIPGLAFDRKGFRLGRGKGFYDRTLKEFPGIRLGVAYSFQMLDAIPHREGDEPVQWLATDKNLVRVNETGA